MSEGAGGEEGDAPAGDAIEVGNMKSSMFMASESGVFERSTVSRSMAMPEGALVDCRLALRMRLSVQVLCAKVCSSGPKHTVPALVLCASNSWPSFSRSDSPCVLDLVIGTWSCYKASIFAFQAGPFSAFHRDRQGRRWRRRLSILKRSSREGNLFGSACSLGRYPACLEFDRRAEGQGLDSVDFVMVELALFWMPGRTAGSRGWKVRGHYYSWGNL